MKKISLAAVVVVLLITTSCKNSSGNKEGEPINNQTSDLLVGVITNDRGESLETIFNSAHESLTIIYQGDTLILKQQPSASGVRYGDKDYEYTEWQGEVELLKNGKTIFSHKSNESSCITETFISPDGKRLTATYSTSTETPTVTINYDTYKDQKFTQISSWAKGAEYESGTMRWTTKEDGGVLTINGKVIRFKTEEK